MERTIIASSVLLQPSAAKPSVGETITVPVVIDPDGIQNFTARLAFTFSPDELEITSFAFGPNWLAVTQPGYDTLNNASGELVKTAGYPKGFSTPVSFGTITFRAKKPGESTITVGTQSFVLDAQSKNTLTSRPSARLIVTEKSKEEKAEEKAKEEKIIIETPQPNLFDVSFSPTSADQGHSPAFFIILILVAILLGNIGYRVAMKFKRWLLTRKLNRMP